MDLLNQLWQDCHNPAIPKQYGPAEEQVSNRYAHYRNVLRRARPFNINNQALEMMYDRSLDGPDRMVRRLGLARLPYETMWIEFDFRHKIEYSHKLGRSPGADSGTPERLGFLLEQSPERPTCWSMTCFSSIPHSNLLSKVLPHGSSFLVDTENIGPPDHIGHVSSIETSLPDRVIPNDIDWALADDESRNKLKSIWESLAHAGWGYSNKDNIQGVENSAIVNIGIVKDLQNSIRLGIEKFPLLLVQHLDSKELIKAIVDSTVEARGDVRLLVTMLSIINEVPTIQTPYKPKGSFRGQGRINQFITNNVVTINIPQKRSKSIVNRMIRDAEREYAKKKRHEVRGHWRVIVHKHNHYRPKVDVDGLKTSILIHKGQIEKVWVPSHKRGDIRMGWVDHTYKVASPD